MGRTFVVTQIAFVALLNLIANNVYLGFVLGCHDVERQALSKFQQSFTDPYKVLPSWKGVDCCLWDGVTCNDVTGYVNELILGFNDYTLRARKLDPALMELRPLNYLDLRSTDFQGSQIPGFIGSFKHLTYLDLSGANFSVVLPLQLGNLIRLQHLDLSGPICLEWATALVNSEHKDMNDVLISNTRNTMQVLTNLPSLTYLKLTSCGLISSPDINRILSNSSWLSSIETLDLSNNLLAGPLPNVYANMSSLGNLALSGNLLNGTIPLWLKNMRKLEQLSLSSNSFSQVEGGVIMGILGAHSKLKYLYLDSNSLQGELGGFNGNFSKGVTPNLVDLYLSNNEIKGSLPFWFGEFKRLKYFEIYSNNISGHIPASIGNLSALSYLLLSNNSLDGDIPEALGQLNNLYSMDLSSNSLKGVVSASHLANLSNLDTLKLGNNLLDLKFSNDWRPPFQLSELNLDSCRIGAQFPRWIKSQTLILELDLSNADISGESLHFLCQFTQLTFLHLRRNKCWNCRV